MKISEIKQKNKPELKILLAEDRDKLRALRFDVQLKQSKNVREIRKTKKVIAQILTILKEKYD
ncbi:50S ribosomal protein L29 [Patescibacteria group bacterium]|nr:50S ribosomal protein L29 [Patescibacteria group bacterium]